MVEPRRRARLAKRNSSELHATGRGSKHEQTLNGGTSKLKHHLRYPGPGTDTSAIGVQQVAPRIQEIAASSSGAAMRNGLASNRKQTSQTFITL